MKLKDILVLGVLSLVLLGGLWLHQLQIGYSPLGIFSDEASIGLNASMIERYQTDEFGEPWPIFFEAFGEYKNPVYIYAVSGMLHFFPLSDVSLRGVSFLFFGVALTMWALFSLTLFKSRWTAVWTTAAFALMPWFFTLSRVAFEAISFVFVYVTLLFVIARFFIKEKAGFFAGLITGALVGLAWYTYSTSRLLMPLLVLNLLMVYFGKQRWRTWWGLLAGGLLLMTPAILLLIFYPKVLLGRFSSLSYIYDPSLSPLQIVEQFLRYYMGYFGPDYQLWNGDANLRHHTGFAGMSYYIVYTLMWLGVGRFLLRFWRREKPGRDFTLFMFLELLAAPVAASLTEPGHTIRVITMIVPMLYFTGYGLDWFRLRTRNVLSLSGIVIASLILALEGQAFVSHAMYQYPYISARYFQTFGIDNAIRAISDHRDTILVVQPYLAEAAAISNYYSLVTGGSLYVTSMPAYYLGSAIKVPYCVLNKKKPYEAQATGQANVLGEIELPLDVRSTLKLSCYPAAQ